MASHDHAADPPFGNDEDNGDDGDDETPIPTELAAYLLPIDAPAEPLYQFSPEWLERLALLGGDRAPLEPVVRLDSDGEYEV